MSDKVTLIQDGVPITVPKEDEHIFLSTGATRVTEGDKAAASAKRRAKARATTPEETAKAVPEGFARGISLGASDWLLAKTGIIDPDKAKARKEHNAGLSTATELLGVVGGALLTGGTSLLAKGIARTPVGLATRGGAALNKMIVGTGGGAARTVLGYAAEGVASTSLFTAGQAISEATLTNKPITAEVIGAGLLEGVPTGLLAGGVAGGFALGAKYAQARQAAKAAKLFDESSDVGKANVSALNQHFDELEGVFKVEPKATKPAPGTARVGEEADTLVGHSSRQATQLDEALPTFVDDVAGPPQQTVNIRAAEAADTVEDVITPGGGLRLNRGRKLVPQAPESVPPITSDSKPLTANLRAGGQGTQVTEDIVKGVKPLRSPELSAARSELAKALGVSTPSAKNLIDVMRSGDLAQMSKAARAFANYEKAALKVNPELESSILGFKEAFKREVEVTLGKPGIMDKAADFAGVLEAVDLATGVIPDEAVLGETGSALLKGALLLRLVSGKAAKKGLLTSLAKAGAHGFARGQAFKYAGKAGLGPGGQLAAVGVAGRLMDKGAAKLLDQNILSLASIQARSEGRIAKAMKFFGKKPSVTGPTKKIAADYLSGIFTGEEVKEIKKEKDPAKQFVAKLKTLNKLNGNQNELLNRAQTAVAPIMALDPELGKLLEKDILSTVSFLQKRAPINPGNMNTILGDRWIPSPQEILKWDRTVRAIQDPAGAVERAAAGRATPEDAEVLKELKPAHFLAMQKGIMNNPEQVMKMPYSVRINLSLFFDVPADPTMVIMPQLQDNFIVANQVESAVQAGQAPEPPGTGLNQPTKAQELTGR